MGGAIIENPPTNHLLSSSFVPPGAYIRSLEGELWGRVVCDQGRSWQLASGRTAKKEILGQTTTARWVMRWSLQIGWKWAPTWSRVNYPQWKAIDFSEIYKGVPISLHLFHARGGPSCSWCLLGREPTILEDVPTHLGVKVTPPPFLSRLTNPIRSGRTTTKANSPQ